MSLEIGVSPTGQSLLAPPRPLNVTVPEHERARTLRDRLRAVSNAVGLRGLGWGALAVGALAFAAGLVLGWMELRAAGVLLLTLVLLSLLFTVGRPALGVEVVLPTARTTVGDDARGRVRVRNAGTRTLLGARLEVPIGRREAAYHLPRLAPEQVHTVDFRIPTERRAVVPVGPARSLRGDPLGLAGREHTWTEVTEVFVHPRTVALAGRHSGFVHDLEGHSTNHLTNADMSFHALREYVPGDDRRHVHWRSSARTGRLMVKQFEETRQSRLAIALDTAGTSYDQPDEFELAVSVAASVVLQAFREENPLGLLTSEGRLPAATPVRTLNELCRVDRGPKLAPEAVLKTMERLEPNASIIVYLTGGSTELRRVRAACAAFDVDARVIGIRCALGESPSIFHSGNVTVLQVGELAQLPRLMREAMQ